MTWYSGEAHLAATTSGLHRVQDASKTDFAKPISYGFTTSDQHLILLRQNGRLVVLDAKRNRQAEIILPFITRNIIEVSPTKFWILGAAGRLVEAQFDPDFSNCQLKLFKNLPYASRIKLLDGQLCVLSKDGLLSPEVIKPPNDGKLSLRLQEADDQFSLLTEQFQKREIKNAIDCGRLGLLLCGSNYFTMHKLVRDKYQSEPIAEWTVPGNVGNHIAWDPYRSVVWATSNDELVALLPQTGKSPQSSKPILKMVVDAQKPIHASSAGGPVWIDAATNICFEYGIPNALEGTSFQYRLQGLEESWSKWTQATVRNYDRLPRGEYRFEVRARSSDGKIVSTSLDKFLVTQPWYTTIPAMALFSLLAVGLVVSVFFLRAKQLAAHNKKMERLVAIRTEKIQKQKREIAEKSELLVQHYRNAESEKLKSFDTLVAGISHDFNNLLAVIATNSELIGFKFGKPAEQITENMQTAIQSAADLCRELSAISDTKSLNLVNDSLQGVVEEVLPILQGTATPRVQLDVKFCDEPTGVSIDVTEIKRAILNLAVNATEVAKQKIIIETSVAYLTQKRLQQARFVGDCPPPGKYTCVSICDDGPGIQPEHLGRLFDPFFSTNELGRGLGLSIVMRVLASHNGVILVEKSELGGACFRLCLPFVDEVEPAKPEPSVGESTSKLRVLLVDDNSMVLQSTSIIIEVLGHEVFSASSAAKGLEVLDLVENIDVIVLDVAMPGMSGVEMAEIVLKKDPGFPIVFVSGYSNDLIRESMLQLPNIDFLNKPYRTSALTEKIALVFDTRCTSKANPPHPHKRHSASRGERYQRG